MNLVFKNKRSFLFLITFIFLGVSGHSQNVVESSILEMKSRTPVAYCAVGIKNKAGGCLTNEQGEFKITASINDTLVINCIGFQRKIIPVIAIQFRQAILIQMSETLLEEVVVYSNNEYLYELFDLSRKHLAKNSSRNSKVYFMLETDIEKQPVELIECYYNGQQTGSKIENLGFKNGRIGIAPYKDRYFVSLNSSKAFTFLNLLYEDAHMPQNPYQFNKKTIKKNFKLRLISTYDSVQPIYKIGFEPLKNANENFRGEIHLQKANGQLVKIILEIQNTQKHPFAPLYSSAKIKDVSMQITKSFDLRSNEILLHHMDFNYQMNYLVGDSLRKVSSNGLMYFYDYNRLFELPYFYYNTETDDYRKITSLTYNDAFWKYNKGLVYTDKMKRGISYFTENGLLVNYKNDGNRRQGVLKNSFFENNYLTWSANKRVRLKRDGIKNDTLVSNYSTDQQIIANRYDLKAQIFLDINQIEDTLQHYSASVFNVFESYYNLKEDKYTNCFMNIYFDLVEIERRKMETEIVKNKHSLVHLKKCYNEALVATEKICALYLKEAERGRNKKKFEEWNLYVYKNLGTNNLNMFKLD